MSITEIAKAAQVSAATVSRVLNGKRGVHPSTAARVESVVRTVRHEARQPRFSRMRSAQSQRRTPKTIAVLAIGHDHTWVNIPQSAAVLTGVQRAILRHNLSLLLEHISPARNSRLLAERAVDGVVALVSNRLPMRRSVPMLESIRRQVPLVWAMGCGALLDEADQVTAQHSNIGRLAAAHLRARRCRRPALVTTGKLPQCRRECGHAFLGAAAHFGLPRSTYVVGRTWKNSEPYAGRVTAVPTLAEFVATIAGDEDRPDGLFLSGDRPVTELHPLLARHGLRVGRDLQLVSCHHEETRLAGLQPYPASIDIGAEEIGYRAVEQLLNRIAQPGGPPLVIQVAPRLVGSSDISERAPDSTVHSEWTDLAHAS